MELFILRHGETKANLAGNLQGHLDTPLTDRGTEQALTVADQVASYEFDVTFSSPLKRALDTAKILAQRVNTDIYVSEALKEMCYGEWEGTSKEALRSHDAWNRRVADKYNFAHPGYYGENPGESYAGIYNRVATFLDDLLDENYDRVMIVSHLGVLRNAKKYFEGCSDDSAVGFSPVPLQVFVIRSGDIETETELRDYR
jgi:broad specificity phosphatase PhoE